MATVDAGTITIAGLTGMAVDGTGGIDAGPVLMILEGGPLDGEFQLVERLLTTPGTELFFNIPHYQTFDPNQEAEVIIGQGLQAIYALVGPGPPPGPDAPSRAGDRWTSSWIFDFTGEAYVPTPPFIPPPQDTGTVAMTQVWMTATTTLVPDTIPVTSEPVVVLVAESTMDVEAIVTPYKSGVVVMSGETVMSVTPDWSPQVYMGDTVSSMEIDPS